MAPDNPDNPHDPRMSGPAVRLSRAQELVWFAQQVAGDVPLYNLTVSYQLSGALDVGRFQLACDQFVASSDVLQSIVTTENADQPCLQRDRSILAACEQIVLGTQDDIETWIRHRIQSPMDPRRRMFQCALLTTAHGRHTFFWCQHHISLDGLNIPLILKYVADRYAALGMQGGESGSDSLEQLTVAEPPSYFQWLEHRKSAVESKEHQKRARYWAEKSARVHDVPEFFGAVFDNSHAKTRCHIALNDDTRQSLERLLTQAGFRSLGRDLSLFVAMATVVMVTGFRLHGKTSLSLGFPTHARHSPTLKRMLGMVTGLGFLDLELEPGISFRLLARRVMREVLQSWSNVEPGMQTRESQQAFSTTLNVLTAPVAPFCGMPVTTTWHYPGCSDSNSQLDVCLTDFDGLGAFDLWIDFADSVFTETERATYQSCFRSVLRAMLHSPETELGRFPIISLEERDHLLKLGAGAPARPIAPATLQDHFCRQVAETPDAIAIRQGEGALSYQALNAEAMAIAMELVAQRVAAGDRVAVCLNRSLRMYPAILGTLMAKAVFVPLDPTYPAERLAFMVADSEAQVILTDADTVIEFELSDVLVIDIAAVIRKGNQPARNSRLQVGESVGADTDAAYIMYTSGSTGTPKGVVGRHSATLNRLDWMWHRYPFQDDEVCCQKTALSFVDSIWELFGPLLKGVPTVVIPDDIVLDVFGFMDVLQSEQVSRLVVVPSFLSVLLDSDPNPGERLRALEICVVSGEPLPLHLASRFLNLVGHCQLLNLYGSTEVTADVTADLVSHDKLAVRMPIGRPIDGVQIYILDEGLGMLPNGAVGEICVAGAALSQGYFGRPDLNDAVFINNPHGNGLLFRTGDLGRYSVSGLIEHHGRADAQLKIRGHRIESAEIENAALTKPGIQAAVLYVGDNEKLYLFYVVALGEAVSESQLLEHLENRLPDYMLPEPVRIQHVPLLSNGKVHRKALAMLLPDVSSREQEFTEPRTDTEQRLLDIWMHTLGLTQLGIHEDFFDVGGNSIAAMRIMVAARRNGLTLSLNDILAKGTIAELGILIDSNPVRHFTESSGSGESGADSRSLADELQTVDALIERNREFGGRDQLHDLFHLTPAQQGILFHLLLQGLDAPIYMAQVRCDLVGTMRPDLFDVAWNRVLERHDMLRSVILHEGLVEPVQAVSSSGTLVPEWHDIRAESDLPNRERIRDKIAARKLDEPIFIDQLPMLRVTLIRMDDELTHLILDWHHILMDGWSLAVLSNEVLLIYAALVEDRDHGLSDVGHFRDHVISVNSQDRDLVRAFWRSRLSGFSVPTPVSQQSDKAAELYARANMNVQVDRESTRRLYDLARACRVTANTLVQAAWSLLLARYNDCDDVLYGFAVTGRSSGINNYENTVGMFVNSLPMRVRCQPTQSLVDWFQSIQSDQMALVEYESSSLSDIQQASELPANTPMFDSLLVFQNVPRLTVSDDFPLDICNRSVHENSPTPITIEVFPSDLLEVQVMYIEEMFVDVPVDRIIAHFTSILKSIASLDSTQTIADVRMMSAEAILEQTRSFNQTARSYPDASDVSDLVWRQAALYPDKTAATFGDGSLSYGTLVERAQLLANYLGSQSIGRGDLVGVCFNRDEHLLVGMLAILRVGAAYLPLDPDYPQNRISHILEDARVVWLLCTSDVESVVSAEGRSVLCLDRDWGAVEAVANAVSKRAADLDELAYVIYTSGSTGLPKGVKVTRRNMVNFLYSMQETPGFTAEDTLLAVTTVSFDIAVLELFLPLISGGRVDVVSRDLTFDGNALVERIEQQGITVMQATPTSWRLLLAAEWRGTPTLKALVGGEPLPRDLASALVPRVKSLWNMYGPTETTVWSCCDQVSEADSLISIGRPIANTEILILDENQQLCPIGIPGELCIAGHGVSAGYVDRDELTSEKFIEHPVHPESAQRVYRTGDFARWLDDGRLECLGRIDNQVKLRGFRIEPGEIESILSELDGVEHALVKLVSDGGSDYLAAYLIPDRTGVTTPPNELGMREFLRESLPLYMIPSAFVLIDSVPRLPNGKVDRDSLPNPDSDSALTAGTANVDVFDLPENQPSTETEKQLSKIWEQALRKHKLSVNSNFFDLGGNSITAMQIMAACRKLGLHLAILDIFNLGSIRLCASAIDAGSAQTVSTADVALSGKDDGRSGKVAMASATREAHGEKDLQRIAELLHRKRN